MLCTLVGYEVQQYSNYQYPVTEIQCIHCTTNVADLVAIITIISFQILLSYTKIAPKYDKQKAGKPMPNDIPDSPCQSVYHKASMS